MSKYHCSEARPWGIHPGIRNDELCRRCGWRAPGPKGDVIAAAMENGCAVIEGGADPIGEAAPKRRRTA